MGARPRFARVAVPALSLLLSTAIVGHVHSIPLQSHLRSAVIGAAGSPGTSGGLRSVGTLGQPTPIGVGSGGALTVHAGFWNAYLSMAWTTDVASPSPLVNRLLQNSPNPFNPTTRIEFTLATAARAYLSVFDVQGALVAVLREGLLAPGRHVFVWNGRDELGRRLASGVYMYRLEAGPYSATRKMVLLK